jgi:hypothetical protein
MFCHRSAGTNRAKWRTFAVATTTCGAPKVSVWAARITSPSIVLSPAVG